MRSYDGVAIASFILASSFMTVRGEDEEKELEVSYVVVSATIMVILTAMVAFSVMFERGREWLDEATDESLKPVLNSLFAELTLLGFIGLSLFLLDKLEAVHVLSEDMFGEDDAIGEISESVHMALFLVMVIFLATVILLIRIGNQVSRKWQRWEENILDEETINDNLRKLISRPWTCNPFSGYWKYGEHEEFQVLVYAALRKNLVSSSSIDEHFNFSEYLTVLLGHILSELVEVPVDTWLGLWVFMIISWICNLLLPRYYQAALIIIFGYSMPVIVRIIHGKVLKIKFDMCSESPLEAPFRSNGIEMETTAIRYREADKLVESGTSSGSLFLRLLNWFSPKSYYPMSLIKRNGTRSELDDTRHHHRWWRGEQVEHTAHAPEFTLDLMRYCLLFNSIYVAVCLLIFFPGVVAASTNEEISGHFAAAVIIVGCIPPLWTLSLAPEAVQEFVITSNLANMKNNRVIEQGVRRMKTRSAFLALKVIYMMTRGVTLNAGGDHQEMAKETVTQQKKKRKVWREIFTIMDDDNSGTLSQKEMTDLIKKVSPSVSDDSIQELIHAIDKDNDNNIEFDEFFEYVNLLSNSFTEKPRDTSDAIFQIIDQDVPEEHDGHGHNDHGHTEDDISIKELQDICNDFKQELSPDDVYQVIKDIDDDGNGRLDKEEFYELLVRLNIVEEEHEHHKKTHHPIYEHK